MINEIVNEIKRRLKNNASNLTKDQRSRMYKILNSDNPNFVGYGNKHSEIEKIVREIHLNYQVAYENAIDIFKDLIKSNVHDEKIAGLFLLNRFKRYFDKEIINLIYNLIPDNFDTWAITDTTMIRVIGPFLGKKENVNLAKKTIENWSKSQNIWIRRASMVILLKLIMLKKDFFISENYVFDIVEEMLQYDEDYIHKGIGWLLKTCSKYKPEIIIKFLEKNKKRLPRLILRYASEKIPKKRRTQILKIE